MSDVTAPETEYVVSGGARVVVIRPFEGKSYSALFELSGGRYPEAGNYAVNLRRKEYVKVLKGSLTYRVGDEEKTLTEGMGIWVGEEVPYEISGDGVSLVIVEDEPGSPEERGRTEIRSGTF